MTTVTPLTRTHLNDWVRGTTVHKFVEVEGQTVALFVFEDGEGFHLSLTRVSGHDWRGQPVFEDNLPAGTWASLAEARHRGDWILAGNGHLLATLLARP